MNNSQDWSLGARCPILVAYGGSHTQSSFFRPVIIFMLVVHILTCPFTVILNLLVMVAVKVKARLRANKSNTLLATLASTDFIAGLFVQPIFIAKSIATLLDKPFRQVCLLLVVTRGITSLLNSVSLFHLTLISGERFLAINRPFAYINLVSSSRLLFASALTWPVAIISHISFVSQNPAVSIYVCNLLNLVAVLFILFCHIAVYRETFRHKKRITALQVTRKERENFKREKRAHKLTAIIFVTLILCFLSSVVLRIIIFNRVSEMTEDTLQIIGDLSLSVILLNSFLNPIIYSLRMKQFRDSFRELLCKTVGRVGAEEPSIVNKPGVTGERGTLRQIAKAPSRTEMSSKTVNEI